MSSVLFRAHTFDGPDKIEESGRLHFESLQAQVFQPLQINLGSWDANALHGHAISQLHYLAQVGSEKCKSVCFGLVYALVALDWCSDAEFGFWQYLSLAQTLDDSGVVIRTLIALSHRIHSLQEKCRSRFFLIFEEFIETAWENTNLVLEVLQRELRPGDGQAGTAKILEIVVKMCICHIGWLRNHDSSARLSFLWSMRWLSALDQPPSSLEMQDASGHLRGELHKLAAILWQEVPRPICDAGPSFIWAIIHFRHDSSWAETWKLASPERSQALWTNMAPQACLDHLLSDSEYEQLLFILKEEGAVRSVAVLPSAGATYPREIPLPQGLPDGWKALEYVYGPQSKHPGRRYVRYHSSNGRHKHIASSKRVIQLHCEELGIPWEPEYAKYERSPNSSNSSNRDFVREARYCQWFVAKHLGEEANASHLADVLLWSLATAEQIGRQRKTLWTWFWNLAHSSHKKGHSQAVLAFLFAARTPGYAREALISALEGVDMELRLRLQELAAASLPPGVAQSLQNFLTA